MDTIIQTTLANFDFAFIISVNILTYIIIKLIDYFNGANKVNIIQKRACLVASIIILGLIYYYTNVITAPILINSAIASPVFWSWIIKPIISHTKLDYKSIDECLK